MFSPLNTLILKFIEKIFKAIKQKFSFFNKNRDENQYKVFHIPMKKPTKEEYNEFKREVNFGLIDKDEIELTIDKAQQFLTKEYKHRQKAYSKALNEQIDKSLLDDSDMSDDYSLFLVCKKTNNSEYNEILLTARVFHNTNDIQKNIYGDENNILMFDQKQQMLVEKRGKQIQQGEAIVIDRMSGKFFRDKKGEIYGRLFEKILDVYNTENIRYIYALARRNKGEILLRRYISWGMEILGERDHQLNKNMRHWILRGEIENMKKHIL